MRRVEPPTPADSLAAPGVSVIDEKVSGTFRGFLQAGTLIAGKRPPSPSVPLESLPPYQRVRILDDAERRKRLDPLYRLPRQVQHIGQLLDWMLTVKDTQAMRFALDMHVARFKSFYDAFKIAGAPEPSDEDE